jgi:stage V sporulation protein B
MAGGIGLKKQTTTKGFAILSMAGIINKVLALVYFPIQLYILGNVGNGIAGAGYNIYIFIFYLSNAGLLNVISKLVSEQIALNNYKNSQKIFKVAGLTLATSGMVFSIFMALGCREIAAINNMPKAYLTVLAVAPAVFFASISSAFKGYFQGFSNVVPTAVSQILEQIVNSTLTIAFMAIFIKYGTIKAAAGTT